MPRSETTHWVPGAAADRHRSEARSACGMRAADLTGNWRGLLVTGDGDRATCYRCRTRWQHGPAARDARHAVTLRMWRYAPNRDLLPDDGMSRWGEAGGRYWRVWPVAGRHGGWHLEEVREDGQPAGYPVRAPHSLDWTWHGGFYCRVATLDDARDTIAYLTDEGPARAAAS